MSSQEFDPIEFRAEVAKFIEIPNSMAIDSDGLWKVFEPVLRQYPESATLMILIGDCLELGLQPQGLYTSSKACYLAALALDPLLPDAYASLALYNRVRNNNKQSLKELETSISLNQNIPLIIELANTYLDCEMDLEAGVCLVEAKAVFAMLSSEIDQLQTKIVDTGQRPFNIRPT